SQLIFSIVDPNSIPSQGMVQSLSLVDHAVTSLLTGESSDPAIFVSDNRILFFNRSFDSQNFRIIEPKGKKTEISEQRIFHSSKVGDPHDVVVIPGQNLML